MMHAAIVGRAYPDVWLLILSDKGALLMLLKLAIDYGIKAVSSRGLEQVRTRGDMRSSRNAGIFDVRSGVRNA
jgi:hypothetical protein